MNGLDLPGLPRRYHLERLLGRGGEKCVYLAMDGTLSRPVAISAVGTTADTEAGAALLHEARVMARIGDRPHLVSVYDVIEAPAALYVVSQYLAGGDLACYLEAHPAPIALDRLLGIGIQVSRALQDAHDAGVAHGDLKPGNVFLDQRGVAHLGDFGFAAVSRASHACEPEVATGFAGSLAYMPPERAWGACATTAGDLYGLGCLLYELGTGAAPFVPAEPVQLLRLKEESRPEAPASRNAAIPCVLSDLIVKLLEHDPERRPTSSTEVRAALEGIARSGSLRSTDRGGSSTGRGAAVGWRRAAWRRDVPTASRSSSRAAPLIQRTLEIEALQGALARARRGEPSVLLLQGEPGIGKTTLLRWLREEAEAMGGIALLGRGHEDLVLPYRPIIDVLLPCAAHVSALPPHEASRLRQLLRLEPAAEAASFEDADRQGLFLAIHRALAELARARPLVVLVDDLQWVDRASLDVFEFLAGALRRKLSPGLGIALVAGHRPVDEGSPLGGVLRRLREDDSCEEIEVAPLSETATFEMIASLEVERPSNRTVRSIYEATQGNPLFIRAAVELLDRNGSRPGVPGEIELPRSLTSALVEHADAVSEPCRRLLTLASFVGDDFELRSLVAVAGHAEEALLELLEEAVAEGLLQEEGGDRYRFAHPLLRQSLYRIPSQARRRQIHLGIATRLEEIHGRDRAAAAGEIAHHLVRAGTAADPSLVFHYARSAAEQAMKSFAWTEAGDLLEASFAAAEASGILSLHERAEIHRLAGLVHHRAGDTERCLARYDAAIRDYEKTNDPAGLARALEGRVAAALQLGQVPYGALADVGALEAVSGHLDAGSARLRARIQGTLASAYWAAQRSDEAQALAKDGLAQASAHGDDRLAAEICPQLALSQLQKLQIEEALATCRAGVAHARRAKDVVREETALQRLPMVLCILGRLDEAERVADEADRLNRTLQSPANLSLTLANRVSLATIRGRRDEAEAHAQECLAILQRARYGWSGTVALLALACARALVSERTAARHAIESVMVPGLLFDDPSFMGESLGRYHKLIDAYAGRPIEPQAATFDPTSLLAAPGGLDFAFVTPLCVEVELAWFAGATPIEASLHEALVLADRRGMLFSTAWPFMIPRLRGVTATLLGRWDEAEQCFVRAIEIADDRRILPDRGRARLDFASMLAAREGGRSPLERTDALLREAHALFEEAGMTGFTKRTVELAGSLGSSL